MTFLWPGLSLAVVLQVAPLSWCRRVAIGFVQIVGAIQLRKEIKDEWLL